jgi:hypothetical protein
MAQNIAFVGGDVLNGAAQKEIADSFAAMMTRRRDQ